MLVNACNDSNWGSIEFKASLGYICPGPIWGARDLRWGQEGMGGMKLNGHLKEECESLGRLLLEGKM